MPHTELATTSSYSRVSGRWMYASQAVDDAPAGAPAVVVVHGIGISSRYMKPLAIQLARSFRVYAVDLPGYGRSDDPGRVLQLSELAEALANWIEVLRLSPVALLGNSLGCQVIVELAIHHPQRVRSVVLQGLTVDPSVRSVPRLLLRGCFSGRERPSLPWLTIRVYAACGLGRVAETFCIAVQDPIERKLPLVGVPALLVRGSRDAIVSQSWTEQAARLLPQGRLVVIPGATHAINYTNPLELYRVVRPFLLAD